MKLASALLWLVCASALLSQEARPLPVAINVDSGGNAEMPTKVETEWRVADFEADADGTIWGIAMSLELKEGPYVSAESIKQLAIFDARTGSWKPHTCEAARGGAAVQLLRLSDGTVACLWRSGQRTVMTKHRKGQSLPWAVLDAVFNQPRLCAGARGEMIITETGPKIGRVPSDGSKATVLTIDDALLTKPEKVEDGSRSYAQVHAVQVGDGSYWLWCYALQPQKHLWRVQGFIRWNGEKLEPVARLPFNEGGSISAVVADGSEHVFVGETGESLWRLPVKGGSPEKIEIPGQMFSYIEQMSFIGSSLHLITCPQPDEIQVAMSTTVKNHLELRTTRHYDTSKPTGRLFQIKDAELIPITSGLDDKPGFGRSSRSVVHTADGLMIGANSGGPTWVPVSGGKARRLGREDGFVLRDAAELLYLENKRWLVRSLDTTWAVIGGKPAPPTGETRLKRVTTVRPMVQDSAQNFWAWRQGDEGFSKWSNGQWHKQLKPPFTPEGCLDMAVDSHDQAWLLSTSNGRSAVLDCATGTWSVFDSPEAAVERKLHLGDQVRIPRYLVFGIISHRNGAKGFLDWRGTVHVLRAGQWTRAKLTDIAGPKTAASGTPYFDSDGRFCIPIEHSHYRLRTDGTWEHILGAKTDNDRTYEWEESKPPKNLSVPNITSTAYDRHGVAWMTQRNGSLWKFLDGAAVRLSASDGLPLLPPHTPIKQVLLDAKGTAMLKQVESGEQMIYQCLSPLPQPPPAKPKTETNADGEPVLLFPSIRQGWHRYRIKGESWSSPTQQPKTVLHSLSPGTHEMEIQSFDAELTPVGKVQSVQIQRNAADDRAIATLIAKLDGDSLEEREKAAALLRIQGPAIIPALQQALNRSEPGTSRHWWLAAIIQSVSRSH